MKKLLAIVAVALMFIPINSIAATTPTDAPKVETPSDTCDGYTDERFEVWAAGMENTGGHVIQNVLFDDNTRLLIVDYRSIPAAPEGFYVVQFDANNCFSGEAWITEQDIRDIFGIVIATE